METEFGNILREAVTPLVLISGVGLILLSLVNRYNQAISRTRSLVSDMRSSQGERKKCLNAQIGVLLKRCNILKLSISAIVVSMILSSFIILQSPVSVIIGVKSVVLMKVCLFSSCICIVVANILLLADISFSLKALRIEVNYKEEK